MGQTAPTTTTGEAPKPATNPVAVVVRPDRKTAMYQPGEKAVFSIEVKNRGEPVAAGKVSYLLTRDGMGEIAKGTLDLASAPCTVSGGLDEPGMLQLRVTYESPTGPVLGLGPAAYEPLKIEPSAKPPADFAEFWDKQTALLAAVPMAAEVKLEEKQSKPQIEVHRVSLASVDGVHVRAWLCRPRQPGKLPAMILGPSAELAPLSTMGGQDWARAGFLVLMPSAHDLPLDESKEFYVREAGRDSPRRKADNDGLLSRDAYPLRQPILNMLRCVDFIASREDWDGKNIIVQGGSYGGGLVLAAAGLDRRVSGVWAIAPAYCEINGQLAGRPRCGPRLDADPERLKKQVEAMSYYDTVHFCRAIRCPVLFTFGLIDTTCPPTTVYSAFNVIPAGDKRTFTVSLKGHRSGSSEYWSAGYGFVMRVAKGAQSAPAE